jgi:histidyl-tRNA synthetase
VERILLAMQAVGAAKNGDEPSLDAYLVSIGPETKEPLLRIAGLLRRAGLRVDLDHEGRGVKAQMRTANRTRAPIVLVLGCDEIAQGQITLKRMATSEEIRVPIDSVVEKVKVEFAASGRA